MDDILDGLRDWSGIASWLLFAAIVAAALKGAIRLGERGTRAVIGEVPDLSASTGPDTAPESDVDTEAIRRPDDSAGKNAGSDGSNEQG